MGLADRVAQIAATIPSIRSETATFVRMDGPFAVVNVGPNTIRVPNVGWVPPVAGMVVQVEWRDGRPIVTGPAVALSPVGEITGTGTPRATVRVDGVDYMLFIRSGYTPALGDVVTVNWQTGIIEGAVTGREEPPAPVVEPPPITRFQDLPVMAWKSGRYQTSWWSSDPRASNSNRGIWVYGTRVQDALRGSQIERMFVYLPLVQELGNCAIGLAHHGDIPAGAPTITDAFSLPVGQRSGWVELPAWWGGWLRDNLGGIGVTAPGGGDNIWRGVPADTSSGKLSFTGTR